VQEQFEESMALKELGKAAGKHKGIVVTFSMGLRQNTEKITNSHKSTSTRSKRLPKIGISKGMVFTY
jgi:hypothetical protein